MTRTDMHNKLMDMTFSEIALMKKYTGLRPYKQGEHEMGRAMHTTEHYKMILHETQSTTPPYAHIEAYWSFCAKCGDLRTKKLIGYLDNDEDGFRTAIVRDFVKGGQIVL